MKLSKEERKICEALGAKYMSRDNKLFSTIEFWKDEPSLHKANHGYQVYYSEDFLLLASVYTRAFESSLREGDCVEILDNGHARYVSRIGVHE